MTSRVAALLAALWLGCAFAASPIPVADFVRKSDYESAKISPNGDFLAVSLPVGEQSSLGIIDLKTRKLVSSLRFALGEHVWGYWWARPDRVIISIANRDGPLDQPRPTGELFAMDANGERKAYLFGYRGAEQVGSHMSGRPLATRAWGFLLATLPQDPSNVLIRMRPFSNRDSVTELVERLDVYNGRRTRIASIPAYQAQIAADELGRLHLAAGYGRDGTLQLLVPQVGGDEWKPLLPAQGPPDEIQVHGASPDGERVFVTSDRGGTQCLQEYAVASGTFADVRCAPAVVGDPVFDFEGKRLLGITHEAGKPELEWLDAQHPDAQLLQALSKGFKGQRVVVTSRTRDGRTLVVRVDSGQNPGDFFLVDRVTRKAEYLISNRSWIDPERMAPVEAVSYTTRDGARIDGYLTVSEGLKARGKPLVIMPHGGPHGVRDRWEWDAWAQLLANRGYAVLQPNYRGSGGYGQAHQVVGYRQWGTLMQDDLTDGARWAIAQGIADPRRLCIFGASWGGYAALMSATREPDLYRCAIAYAGVYDLEAQAEDADTANYFMGRTYLEKVLGTDEDAFAAQSPVTYVAKLKAPVLIAHGTRDKRVPFSQAKILRKALKKHDKPFEWMEFSGEEHGFYSDANHEAFLTKALEFLDHSIGAPAPAAPPRTPEGAAPNPG